MKTFPYTADVFASLLLQEVDRLDTAYKHAPATDEGTQWTAAMKQWLHSIAMQHDGMRVIYTAPDMGEFLLDLIWWHDGPPQGAVLACEMEWGNTRDPKRNTARVEEDFDKLLSFKAPFKLMLFDSYSNPDRHTEMVTAMQQYLQSFGDHRAGEQYLVIDVSKLRKAWLCNITRDGEDRFLMFRALAR